MNGRAQFSDDSATTISISDTEQSHDRGKSSMGHVVVKHHTGILLGRYWIHLLAVLFTGAVATLNFLEVFLMADGDDNTVAKLNAFQFVAKVHEATLLGSLILILMDAIRAKLLSPEGTPLGHLLAPFTFTNFDFLASGQFWRCIQFKAGNLSNSVLLLLAIPFANVAGPLLAVTIVPRLGWSRSEVAAVFPHFFNESASTFWPEIITASNVPAICLNNESNNDACPESGVISTRFRMDYSLSPGAICVTDQYQSSCNVSMSDSQAASSITRALAIEFSLDSIAAYASTPSSRIFETIARKFELGISFFTAMPGLEFIAADKTQLVEAKFSSSTGFFKPVVATSCEELDYSGISQLLADYLLGLNWSAPGVTWLDDIGMHTRPSFLFSYRIDAPELTLNETCTGQECYAAVSCVVDARWMAHKIWYNTAQPGILFHGDTGAQKALDTNAVPIQIKRDWLDLLTTTGSITMAEEVTKLINNWRVPRSRSPQPVANVIQENIGPTNHSVAIAIIVAATLTESLAQQSEKINDSLYNGDCNDTKPGFIFPPEVCAHPPAYWARNSELGAPLRDTASMITFGVRRSGYGWFLLDSIVIKIALGVLLLHALFTIVYLLCTLIGKRIVTTRWSSAAELLILAIDSFRAPELIGSTVRVTDSEVWRRRVTLREVDSGDRLSLIVGEPHLYPERVKDVPQVDKKYQ